VQDQQHRVGAVLAPELDPLVDPPDLDEALLDDSVIPLGVSISSALVTRRWRVLRQASPPTTGAAMMPAAPPRMVRIMAAPQVPGVALCCRAGASVCRCKDSVQSPFLPPGLAWSGDGFGIRAILARAVESIGSW
jgi:hypothetical protein